MRVKLYLLMALSAVFSACENDLQLLENQSWGGINTLSISVLADQSGTKGLIESGYLPDKSKIGVQQGTTGDIYATDDYGDEHIERYNKGMEAVQALAQGKVDAVIIDDQPAKTFAEQVEGLKILETEYVEEDYAMAVKKGNDELLEKVNAAIKELKEDGTFDEIISKYITD